MIRNKRTHHRYKTLKTKQVSHVTSEAIDNNFLNFIHNYTVCVLILIFCLIQMGRIDAIRSFLDQYSSKPIDPVVAASLDSPLTEKEFKLALGDMKPGKSPGPDGFTIQYFRSFIEILYSHFLAAFESSGDNLSSFSSLLKAHIVVLPKPGKDPSLVINYRPISLLNTNVKLYTKILANRLLPYLPTAISLDQVGFVPSREARDNIIKTLNLHHWLSII